MQLKRFWRGLLRTFGRGPAKSDYADIVLPSVAKRLEGLSGKKVSVWAKPTMPPNWEVDNLMEQASGLISNRLFQYFKSGEYKTAEAARAQLVPAEITLARKEAIAGAITQTVRAELTAALRKLPSRHTIGKEQFSADEIRIIKSVTGKVLSSLSHDMGVQIPSEILGKY